MYISLSSSARISPVGDTVAWRVFVPGVSRCHRTGVVCLQTHFALFGSRAWISGCTCCTMWGLYTSRYGKDIKFSIIVHSIIVDTNKAGHKRNCEHSKGEGHGGCPCCLPQVVVDMSNLSVSTGHSERPVRILQVSKPVSIWLGVYILWNLYVCHVESHSLRELRKLRPIAPHACAYPLNLVSRGNYKAKCLVMFYHKFHVFIDQVCYPTFGPLIDMVYFSAARTPPKYCACMFGCQCGESLCLKFKRYLYLHGMQMLLCSIALILSLGYVLGPLITVLICAWWLKKFNAHY